MARPFSDQQIKAAVAAVGRALKDQAGRRSQEVPMTASQGTSGTIANATLIAAAPTNSGEDELLTIQVTVSD